MTTQTNALEVIAYWKGACEVANGMVAALMADCAELRTARIALMDEIAALRTALRETREALTRGTSVMRHIEDTYEVCTPSCQLCNAFAVLAKYAVLAGEAPCRDCDGTGKVVSYELGSGGDIDVSPCKCRKDAPHV